MGIYMGIYKHVQQQMRALHSSSGAPFPCCNLRQQLHTDRDMQGRQQGPASLTSTSDTRSSPFDSRCLKRPGVLRGDQGAPPAAEHLPLCSSPTPWWWSWWCILTAGAGLGLLGRLPLRLLSAAAAADQCLVWPLPLLMPSGWLCLLLLLLLSAESGCDSGMSTSWMLPPPLPCLVGLWLLLLGCCRWRLVILVGVLLPL